MRFICDLFIIGPQTVQKNLLFPSEYIFVNFGKHESVCGNKKNFR